MCNYLNITEDTERGLMDTERACVMLITLEKTNLILRRKLSVHQYSAVLSNNKLFLLYVL